MNNAAEILERCYAAAVAAVQPDAALRGPLHETTPGAAPCWIVSVGKAAPGMAGAIVEWLRENDREPAGGIVVAPEPVAAPHAALAVVIGDHPLPGAGSARAAAAIGELLDRVPIDHEVHIAISGGASALIAGPLPGLTMGDVTHTFTLLLSSGLDIQEMNAVRKRVTRWSAGRLALHLASQRLHVWVISDVPGDDLGSIASGPCTGDTWTSEQVRRMLVERRLFARLPVAVQRALDHETPKPTDPRLASIRPRLVASNRFAMAAAADMAHRFGIRAQQMHDPLHGEAAVMGRCVADAMAEITGPRQLLIWGGETTVTLTGAGGRGGRSQELALAAARGLHRAQKPGTLLAAGTDGRDGPTDAAGAIVDETTWQRIAAAGRDPEVDLVHHDAYYALDAAGALLRTGHSGTNVMDLAIALSGELPAAPS